MNTTYTTPYASTLRKNGNKWWYCKRNVWIFNYISRPRELICGPVCLSIFAPRNRLVFGVLLSVLNLHSVTGFWSVFRSLLSFKAFAQLFVFTQFYRILLSVLDLLSQTGFCSAFWICSMLSFLDFLIFFDFLSFLHMLSFLHLLKGSGLSSDFSNLLTADSS